MSFRNLCLAAPGVGVTANQQAHNGAWRARATGRLNGGAVGCGHQIILGHACLFRVLVENQHLSVLSKLKVFIMFH